MYRSGVFRVCHLFRMCYVIKLKKIVLESRSYSAGAVYPSSDQADVFGSVISDNGELTEDTSESNCELSSRSNSRCLRGRSPAPKAVSYADTSMAIPSRPPTRTRRNTDSETTLMNNHECANHKTANAKQNSVTTPSSKSDGNICSSRMMNNVPHSHSQNLGKHYQNQQCCSGFGTGNRHRFHSNACIIV